MHFSYEESESETLEKIDLRITKSKPVAVIGLNGAGKSTLIKIIAGLYNNYKGTIRVNDDDLREIDSNDYRNKVTVIFQDFNHYELTLRENIAFSKTDDMENDEKIIHCGNIVGLTKTIVRYNKGIDSQMGKWFGGEELSKGQWQRVAISRVLFRDADVIIMDEPTSSLDPIIEKEIFDLISKLAEEKILILVTHRVEHLKKYDPWYVFMEEGTIIEQGEYDRIRKSKAYQLLTD